MKVSEEKAYRAVLEEAAQETFSEPPENLKEAAFHFWQKAVHNVLILNGCQCAHYGGKCFLDLDKEKQISLYANSNELSFESFLEILVATRQMFLTETLAIVNS